jgi:hypothetical protein
MFANIIIRQKTLNEEYKYLPTFENLFAQNKIQGDFLQVPRMKLLLSRERVIQIG